MKKALSLALGITLLICGTTLAQNVIDFENMAFDVLANHVYQANTPFFPGVFIQTIDTDGIIKGWPIVVRANPQSYTCLEIPPPHGSFIAFRSNLCGTNSILNYPVHSDYNSLSKGSIDARIPDGFVITFDYPISEFSVWFADWGDWFPISIPEESMDGYIKLIAYDAGDDEIASTESIKLEVGDLFRDASNTEPNGIFNLYFSTPSMRKVEIRFIGRNDPGVTIDDIEFTGELNIDIKPGSYPNCFNSNGNGVIPVAILGSEDFDVSTVDPASITFGPTGAEAAPLRWAFEDVDSDGYVDMILHFKTQDCGFSAGDETGILICDEGTASDTVNIVLKTSS